MEVPRLTSAPVLALLIAVGFGSGSCRAPGPTLEEVRLENRERMGQLAVGMSKAEVLEKMGEETILTYEQRDRGLMRHGPKVEQPSRTETVQTVSGVDLEVLWYYTEYVTDDAEVWRDETSPLVFQDDRLIGWGRPFLKERLSR